MTESVALGILGLSVPAGTHLAAATRSGGHDGLTRATGEKPSVLNQPAGRAGFFRYEAGLNDVIPKFIAGRS